MRGFRRGRGGNGWRWGFVDGEGLVVAELRVVSPYGLPFGAVRGDLGVVGDDFDVCGLIWMLAS
jgi:hypothetical protein